MRLSATPFCDVLQRYLISSIDRGDMENEDSKLTEFDTGSGADEVNRDGGEEQGRNEDAGVGPSELVTAGVDGPTADDDEVAGGREVVTADDFDVDAPAAGTAEASRRVRCDLQQNDRYACDRQTVRALAHMIPAGDRARVDAWLEKLDGCDDPADRSQYVEYLLRAVADGGNARADPFGRPPPRGPLRPLREIVDPLLLPARPHDDHRHRTVAAGRSRPSETKPPAPAATSGTRETFYARQPIPEDGTFCYAAAFSHK